MLILDDADAAIGAVGISGDTADRDEACAIEATRRAGLRSDPGAAGRFDLAIEPVTVAAMDGSPTIVRSDEQAPPDTTLEKQASLPAPFRAGGTVIAGSDCAGPLAENRL